MATTRRFRILLAALSLGALVAGTAAVATWGDEPSDSARAEISGSTTPDSDPATPRATPAEASAPVAVDTAPAPVAPPAEPAPVAPAAPEPVAAAPAPAPAPPAVGGTVQAQIDYALAHWTNYNVADYGTVTGNDCVNFTSWWTKGTGRNFTHSTAWVSSTAMRNYIASSGRATALTDRQRDQVKVGDVVQFDWDNSGDRDHTGVVTRVEATAAGIEISYAGHTDDTDYRTVDYAITVKHPGASVFYWSIP
jgi:hypothetical protein